MTEIPAEREFLGSKPREHLTKVLTRTDPIEVSQEGDLIFDGYKAEGLLADFGSPLYVVSEQTLRENFRRIKGVFERLWPTKVLVMYAIKSNNNPAIRAVIHQEGGGGDCFGLGELHSTFMGGADPERIAMNGSNKTEVELRAAIRKGVHVNIDAVDEIRMLDAICADLGTIGSVALRIKSAPESLAGSPSDYMGLASDVRAFLLREKWGFSVESALELVPEILECRNLRLRGFSLHTPRFTQNPELFATCTRDFAESIIRIREATGYVPELIDIGGGWPRDRDPESRMHKLNGSSVENFAEAVVASLLDTFEAHQMPIPELRLEPGRFIVGNAVVLLGRVGQIKRDCGMVWVNVDFSTNNLPRIDTAGSAYHFLPASGLDRSYAELAQIVGSTCIDSRMADNWAVPDLATGEPVAILDAGMYADSASTQFNSVPRPATVMISDGTVHIIKRRETVEDLYRNTSVPDHLLPE
ncbi:hypothetical protein OE766_28515 [Pararhizobium sp. YC-54]|uniref:diaminopimelate decarboxylase family protein n=1 Tax=Pararhizobium sp. YC-54 TaxID=2986920 RepID=UPI0021F74097|nr:hypothetical protein [Pararhizobium sp. YC-54]MCW0002144.1 hypothetical protein [Pararhizobium sp. YC-54]